VTGFGLLGGGAILPGRAIHMTTAVSIRVNAIAMAPGAYAMASIAMLITLAVLAVLLAFEAYAERRAGITPGKTYNWGAGVTRSGALPSDRCAPRAGPARTPQSRPPRRTRARRPRASEDLA